MYIYRGSDERTPDDNVFDSPCNVAIAFAVKRGFISCMYPLLTILVNENDFDRLLGILPVFLFVEQSQRHKVLREIQ